TGGPGQDTRVNRGDFAYSGPELGERYECSIDSTTDFAPCGQDFPLASLAQGRHAFRVGALDALGTRGPTVERDFTWDTVAPRPVIAPFSSPTRNARPTFSYSADDDGAGHYTFDCRLDSPTARGATEQRPTVP